ncbi:dual OB domain-containing protein [Streptomyces sp. CCM_MD2014]|uniref:dual OB domain-containing protein n=1 Tax=Streptomyces sp. CCM_MD2014 TaxID=1561022 RepID=UPI0018F6263B|nr:hypothetical protein [Streptomyces sp. CCM_MD2014]MDA4885856.1 hypothetical protein [Streptomyces sp. MS2A]
MEKTVRMVCLANSRKNGGRCVAGMEVVSKSWMRPVSRRLNEEVSAIERQYVGKVEPQVLDVVKLRLTERKPSDFQRENWLFDHTVRWEKVGRIGWEELNGLEQQPESLWIDGYSTWGGLNNKIPVSRQDEVSGSLVLIRVDAVEIKGDGSGLFAHFDYMGRDYAINLTDPVYEEIMEAKGYRRHKLGESFITVSLGKEWHGYLFKFVAAIIERSELESGDRQ